MTKAEIIGRFGSPDYVMGPQDGFLRWDFYFTLEEKSGPRRFAVSGLTVVWRDEKMIRWAPSYGTIGGKAPAEFMAPIQPLRDPATGSNANRSISFWPVSSQPIEGGRYVDTADLPKLGWIGGQPALQVSKLKSIEAGHETVNYGGKGPREEYRFDLELIPDDAQVFHKLTEQMTGRKLLFMADEQVLMAPKVIVPIVTGRFSVTV